MRLKRIDYIRIEQFKDSLYKAHAQPPHLRNHVYPSIRRTLFDYQKALRRNFTMTKKKTTKTTEKFVFKGYVNINIPATMKKACDERIGDISWITQSVGQAIVDGMNLKIYWDNEAGHYRASFTGMNPESDNHGYLLSAYAGDWLTAIGVLCFKHFEVSGENWSGFVQEELGTYG